MTRLPQLEHELVAAAGRLGSSRRLVRPAARMAVAIAAVVAALAVADVVAVVDGGGGNAAPQGAGAPPFPEDVKLEDMLGVFREPATPADDLGFTKDDFGRIPDRQPGEDPTKGRRIEWPGGSISIWPMRDGVCYGVRGGGGCIPLDHLRRLGVSVGTHSSQQGSSVHGVVVDGIDEVVVTSRGGEELTVPVRENFFFVALDDAAVERVETVSWRYRGEERAFDVGRFLERAAPPVPDVKDGEPVPDIAPLPGSVSEERFIAVDETGYTAIGFHSSRSAVCVLLEESSSGRDMGQSCLNERLLRDALARQPVHIFAGGSTNQVGFARADVVEITPATGGPVALSEPWSPEPWDGEPIRFFFVFGLEEPRPGDVRPPTPLEVRLADGQTVRVP